jgi:hypothetical protein
VAVVVAVAAALVARPVASGTFAWERACRQAAVAALAVAVAALAVAVAALAAAVAAPVVAVAALAAAVVALAAAVALAGRAAPRRPHFQRSGFGRPAAGIRGWSAFCFAARPS